MQKLRNHVRLFHSQVVECDVCGKKLKNKHDYYRHKRRNHEEKKFKCDYCEKRFVFERDARIHVQNVHTKGHYPCDQCDSVFTSPDYLYMHKHNIHKAKEKAFRCEDCGKLFAKPSQVTAHYKGKSQILLKPVFFAGFCISILARKR